jgi:hypothetical protein
MKTKLTKAQRDYLERAVERGIKSGPTEIAVAKWWRALDAELKKNGDAKIKARQEEEAIVN